MIEASLDQYRKPYRTIRPRSGWQALNLRDLWKARELLLTLATRDVKLRYRQTVLGVLWVVIQPILAATIFSLVFGRIANLPSHGIPYFIFAYTGLLAWNAYQTTLTRVSGCIVQNNHVIVKVSFPRLVLPISTVLSVIIDFAVALLVLLVLILINGIRPGAGVLLLPVWLFLILLLALGVGLAAATLMVIYRDVQYVIPVIIQLWLYASPVAYGAAAVPAQFRAFYFLNPLSALLEAFRWSLLGRGEMRWEYIAYSAAFSFIVFICGALIFKRLEPGFADVI
jgi:lipopolysaccharide transport system permease protein